MWWNPSTMKSLNLESNSLKPKLFSPGGHSFSWWGTAKAGNSAS